MELLHQVWHNWKWNLDSFFENKIWDWFIFTAYSIDEKKIWTSISWYSFDKIINNSLLDLQYYGGKSSNGGKFCTYDFHPIHSNITMVDSIDSIMDWVKYQIKKGFTNIIIPHAYYNSLDTQKIISIIKSVNNHLIREKVSWVKYFMTLPISNDVISNKDFIDELLFAVTDKDIAFDWYYVVCESKPWTRKKISDNFLYYNNLYRILDTLKTQQFEIVYAYANFDAIVFYSLINIDYISIGTYENLRNFNIKTYTQDTSWWPSEWWYFSEKLLNMIKAQILIMIRTKWCLEYIKNENNIFSDEILSEQYQWNTHKPQVHKNYLLAINNIFKKLSTYENLEERKMHLIEKIEGARRVYKSLEEQWVYLMDESWDYFLGMWLSFLKSVKL